MAAAPSHATLERALRKRRDAALRDLEAVRDDALEGLRTAAAEAECALIAAFETQATALQLAVAADLARAGIALPASKRARGSPWGVPAKPAVGELLLGGGDSEVEDGGTAATKRPREGGVKAPVPKRPARGPASRKGAVARPQAARAPKAPVYKTARRGPPPKRAARAPALYRLGPGETPAREQVGGAMAALLAEAGLTPQLLDAAAMALLTRDCDLTMLPPVAAPRAPGRPAAVQKALAAGAACAWVSAHVKFNDALQQHYVDVPLAPRDLPEGWLPAGRGAAPDPCVVQHFNTLHFYKTRQRAHYGWWLQLQVKGRTMVSIPVNRRRGAHWSEHAPVFEPAAGEPVCRALAGADTWLAWLLLADAVERATSPDVSQHAVHFAVTPGELQWLPQVWKAGDKGRRALALPYWPTGAPLGDTEAAVFAGKAVVSGTSVPLPGLPLGPGTAVAGNWYGYGEEHPGHVTSANADGSFHVSWDLDCTSEWSMPRHRLRVVEGAGGSSGGSSSSDASGDDSE